MMVASTILLPYMDLAPQVPGLKGIVPPCHLYIELHLLYCSQKSLWATQKENLQNLTLL